MPGAPKRHVRTERDMKRPRIVRHEASPTDARAPWGLDFGRAPGALFRALIVVLALWVLHSFLEAMLAASVTAVASWPLYTRFANRMPARVRPGAPLLFTCLLTVFVLAPLVFAVGALLGETHTLILEIAAADERGIGLPPWLERVPLVGAWIAARWQQELANPGALMQWAQRTDPALLLGWARSMGHFAVHHALVIGFASLLLFVLYRDGEVLAQGCRHLLRRQLGPGVEHYVRLSTRAVRASLNSMLVVGLFDGLATGVAIAVVGVPHPAVWGAMTGVLSPVPFLGYVAVGALALKLAVEGAAGTALTAPALGIAVLLIGDKFVRPAVARGGAGLPFVWVLTGCLGGFEVLELVGLVVGPVVLTLARELWTQWVREAAAAGGDEAVAAAEAVQQEQSSAAAAGP